MNRLFPHTAVAVALAVLPAAAVAQMTHYTPVEAGKYEAYMNFTGQVVENGVPVNGAEVAMFVAGECRQTQVSHNISGTDLQGNPYSIDGLVTSYLAWGQSHRENITFKVWLPSGEERELAAICPLIVDSRTGMPSQPFILDIGKTAHNVVMDFRKEGEAVIGTYSDGTDGNVFATEETFTYDGLTITATDQRPTDSYVNYISDEQGLRLAPGASLTLTAPPGYVIIGVWPLNISQRLTIDQTGAVLDYEGWSGSAQSITLTNTNRSTQNLYGIEVRYAKDLLRGDVNRDGQITISDATALVDIILGKDNVQPYRYDHEAADVNADAGISIADVTVLVNIILGKDH
ncbi:MAG: dockerin type I repeat-containing protein [Prevotella sp.]|nr:dockerin type I repeat-containing protein [Prevotella sp.]